VKFLVALLAACGIAAAVIVHQTQPVWYARIVYPLAYEQIVEGHARNYDLDPALLAAVIYQESKFDADARSRSGAIGLMQLMPATARGIAVRTGGRRFRVGDLYDPEINVRYGSWYLRHLLDKYGNVEDALAAYNGGQGNVDRGVRYAETEEYVDHVLALRQIYRRAYGSELRALTGGDVKE
jgi:soluble lytic murein transglycosylase